MGWLREVHIWVVHFSLYGFWLTFGSLLPSPQSTHFMFGFQWKLIMIKIRGWKQCSKASLVKFDLCQSFQLAPFFSCFFTVFIVLFYLFFLFYLCFYSHPSLHLFAPSTFFFPSLYNHQRCCGSILSYCLFILLKKKKNLSASLEVFLLI